MYVVLEHDDGRAEMYGGDGEVFAAWRWQPVQRMRVTSSWPGQWVRIEATDGPYSGPEYPTGGPR